MTKKQLAAGALVAILATTGTAYAATFNDVPSNHWAEPAIDWASDEELMTGPGERPGSFDPGGLANRAQLATVFMRFSQMMDQKLADIYTTIDAIEQSQQMDVSRNLMTADMLDRAFMTRLSGSQEVPVVNTPGSGTGYFMLASDGLHYHIELNGLQGAVTGANIRSGAIGVEGPARHNLLFSNGIARGIWRTADITADDLASMLHGELYVSIDTNTFVGGEIRGQIVPIMSETYHGTMSAAQETADVDSGASGMAHVELKGNMLIYKWTYTSLTTNFTGAHFHRGYIGENGGIAHEVSCDTANMICTGTWDMSDADKQLLMDGGIYANIHSERFPAGELRGQLMYRE